jgi:hypothetical protein
MTDVFVPGLLLYEIMHKLRARGERRDLQSRLAHARTPPPLCQDEVCPRAPAMTPVCERTGSMGSSSRYADGTRFESALSRPQRPTPPR